jgi:hypothetical protein
MPLDPLGQGNLPVARDEPSDGLHGAPLAGVGTEFGDASRGAAPQGVAAGGSWIDRVVERARLFTRAELLWPALVVFFASLPVFSRLVGAADVKSPYSDHKAHLLLALRLAAGGADSTRGPVRELKAGQNLPPHPLFHLCLFALSAGNNPEAFAGIAAVLLALAIAGRAYLTALRFTSDNAVSPLVAIGLCILLALATPLPNWWWTPRKLLLWTADRYLAEMPAFLWDFPCLYLGQVSPNVWHNPTGIFAMPFALLVFVVGLHALETQRTGPMVALGAALVLSLLAKPNYVLAFAPCFAAAAGVGYFRAVRSGRLRLRDVLLQLLAAAGPPLAVLLYQFRSQYGTADAGQGRVIWSPFLAWSVFSRNIPVSLLLSIAFPLTSTLLYARSAVRNPAVLLAWAAFAVAVAQYALLAESGDRVSHGNFGWGPVLANQVLFVACCDFLLRQPASGLRRIAFLVLGAHAACGSITLIRCLLIPSLANVF